MQASPDWASHIKQALKTCQTTLIATAASCVLLAAHAEEVTLQFQAAKNPEVRKAQTDLVQTYGAAPHCN